jgi:hypothetical protein
MDTKRALVFGAVSIAALAAGGAGCNLIVSSGDYHVEEVPGSGGGDATTDTSVPVVDAGGGSDANTSEAEASVACGSTIPTTSTDFQQLVRACVLHIGCDPYLYYNSDMTIAQCIATSSLNSFGATSCEGRAQNCSDINACTGNSWALDCDGGVNDSFCDSKNRAVNCQDPNGSESPGYAYDCTKQAGTCRTYVQSVTDAGPVYRADCVVTSCNGTDGRLRCDGNNNLFRCVGDAGFGESCGVFQETCRDPPDDSGAGCYFNLPPCADGGTPACDTNDVGQICYDFTKQVGRFHCGAAGLQCNPTADTALGLPFTCVTPGCTQKDIDGCVESCTNDIATFCMGGAKVTFDCTSIPGMKCHQLKYTDPNAPPVTFAQCKPI